MRPACVTCRTDWRRDPPEDVKASKRHSPRHAIPLLNQRKSDMTKSTSIRIALAMGSIALASCAAQPNTDERPAAYQDFRAGGASPNQTTRATGTYVGTIDKIEATNRRDASNLVTVRLDNGARQSVAMANIAD